MRTTALILVVIAVPLQLLGLTSTCTQGADGTFLTGVVLSAPLLIVAALLLAVIIRRRPRREAWKPALWTGAVTALSVILTRDAWLNSVRYGTPCGYDFSGLYGSSSEAIVVIVAGYLILPFLIIGLAIGVLVRDRRPQLTAGEADR